MRTNLALFLFPVLFLLACHSSHSGAPAKPGSGASPLPDFHLLDVNATSSTYGNEVSPRDYLGRVAAFYFGAAT